MKKYFKKLSLMITALFIMLTTSACGLPGLSDSQGVRKILELRHLQLPNHKLWLILLLS